MIANLSFSILVGANFRRANLQGALLQETALVDAIFSEANFTKAQLAMCSILGSKFRGAIFDNTSFVECLCRDTVWCDGKIIDDSMI